MRKRDSVLVCIVGAILLVLGLWGLYAGLSDYKPQKIETLQGTNSLSTTQGYGTPVYVHPNLGVGPTDARYNLAIRVDYLNVKGNLTIEDYYVQYGSVPYESRQKLSSQENLTGNGSVTFEIPPTYVGVHVIVARADYAPNPPIEVNFYTINYAPKPDNARIILGLVIDLIGASLISIGATLAILGNRNEG